jgi:3(or 17)beta-hydroxysteroid dehydrogenase
MRLKNKIALITGGASGIGRSCAEIFAQEGATVIVTDINDQNAQQLVAEIGKKSLYHHLDVKSESEWKKITSFIQERFKSLDILVNNAGITGFVPDMGLQDPECATLESWHHVHAVNLDGVFLGCKYGISMMKTNGGSIINISSRSGIVGIPRAAAYASSKAAVRNHTKTVALYCAEEKYNIRCNSIHPAAILTPMWDPMIGHDNDKRKKAIQGIANDIPLKSMGEPSDVAYAALYLASNESKYLTGIELNIDGGILAGSAASPKQQDQ